MKKDKLVKKIFSRDFAPQEGLVKSVEKPYRDEICLNGSWQFKIAEMGEAPSKEEIQSPGLPAGDGWEPVPLKVPSPWNINGFSRGGGGDFVSYPSYPDSWKDVKAGWLKRTVPVPEDWSGHRLILHFEAIAGFAKVYVNNQEVGENFDPFIPFHFDVTAQALTGQDLEVLVWVADGNLLNEKGNYGYRKYVSGSFWGTYINGIWQDVYLQKMPALYVTDTFVKPLVDRDLLEIEVTVKNTTDQPISGKLNGTVHNWINGTGDSVEEMPEISWSLGDQVLSAGDQEISLSAGEEKVFHFSTAVQDSLELWSPRNPALYGLIFTLDDGTEIQDKKYTRFGWRQFTIKGKKFLLNGKTFRIKADSWHFMGVPQMTRRYACSWYRMVKESNGNGIRLHAQVYPRFYLEMADEMGMCILDESGIWFSDMGPKMDTEDYWDAARKHVKAMVLRDRNYPSVLGWSVCNETVEVARMVFHAPKEIVNKNLEEMRQWIAITRENDPTRDWISGDGELYGKTGLPTLIEHYAWRGFYPFFSLLRKPWGTGETGMAYYGTPQQISKVKGHRAFESQQGRMEGVAAEAFDLIKAQRKAGSSYASVFNNVWYGLKPLAFGLADIAREPGLDDGIFFTSYEEGKPGYQPERLGPYTSTLNPGYDPDLPLYDPWPFHEAIKAAYSDDYKKRKNIWKIKKDTTVKTTPAEKKESLVWLSGEKKDELKRLFENCGLRFDDLSLERKQLIILDGANPPFMNSGQKDVLRSAVTQGSSLLIWNPDESSAGLIKSLTGSPIEFYKREATSYIIKNSHSVIRGENHKSLYFSELSDRPLSTRTMGGKWVDEATVILEACNTDWTKWNYQGENIKTAKVYRSEREAKPRGEVLVQQKSGKGEILVSTLDLFALTSLAAPRVSSMIRNLGGPLKGPVRKTPKALNRRYNLVHALETDSEGKKKLLSARMSGTFVMESEGDSELSFWVYSPRALDDLLIEPDVPKLNMILRTDSPVKCAINECELESRAPLTYSGVPMHKGWNKVVIKLSGRERSKTVKIGFRSTRRKFMRKLKSLAER